MKQTITVENVNHYQKTFEEDEKFLIAMNAVTANGIKSCSKSIGEAKKQTYDFSFMINPGHVSNQKKSGKCWIYAAINYIRNQMIDDFGIVDFELSQNYIAFYDLFEKANYFIEKVLDLIEEPLDDRLLIAILTTPIQDAGQWSMFCNIIDKYGMVTKTAMPDTKVSENTNELIGVLSEKLRGYARILRNQYETGASIDKIRKRKNDMLKTIYRMLCIGLGCPPKSFSFVWKKNDEAVIKEDGITPMTFYKKYISRYFSEGFVSIINAPNAEKPFYRSYVVKHIGNVFGGNSIRFLNLPMEEIKLYVLAQIKDQTPVWFGCDASKFVDKDRGMFNQDIYNYEKLFNTELAMLKDDNLLYCNSVMTHAMVLEGVHFNKSGGGIHWLVENSYGTDIGINGHFVMADKWLDKYVYQVVIREKYIKPEHLKQYNEVPILLEPWDPMGVLASK